MTTLVDFKTAGNSFAATLDISILCTGADSILCTVLSAFNSGGYTTITSVVLDPGGANITLTAGTATQSVSGSTNFYVNSWSNNYWYAGSLGTGTKTLRVTLADGSAKPQAWAMTRSGVSAISAPVEAFGANNAPVVTITSAVFRDVIGFCRMIVLDDTWSADPNSPATQISRVKSTDALFLRGGAWIEAGTASVVLDGNVRNASSVLSTEYWGLVAWSLTPSGSSAPNLSAPTGAGGGLLCSGTVVTDVGNGTLYAVATGSATQPSAVQVEAGQDNTGSGALRVVSQAVVASGTQTVASGAVTAGTRYLHYMHKDVSANRSTVSTTASFVVTNAAATAITMTGPSGGPNGSASSVFIIAANGVISGTVVVTPSSGGGGGTFTPSTVSISSGSPTATFTYTPASVGVKTISASNNGSLSNPTPISYTSSSTSGAYTLSFGPGYYITGSGPQLAKTAYWTIYPGGTIGSLTGIIPVEGSGTCDSNGVWTVSNVTSAGACLVIARDTDGAVFYDQCTAA